MGTYNLGYITGLILTEDLFSPQDRLNTPLSASMEDDMEEEEYEVRRDCWNKCK